MVHPVLPPHLPAPGISPHQHPDDHRLSSLSNLHIPKEALRTGTSPCTPLLSLPSARGPHMRPESRCRDTFPRQAQCPCRPSLCPRSPLRIIRAPPSLPSILHSMSPAQRDRPPPPPPPPPCLPLSLFPLLALGLFTVSSPPGTVCLPHPSEHQLLPQCLEQSLSHSRPSVNCWETE